MSEVVAQHLDVLAGVQQNRGVEVPEGVHAVFAGSLMALARLRRGNDPSRDQSGLPRAVIEVGPSNRTLAIETGEQQSLRDWRAVRPEPRQGDLDRRERLHVSARIGTVRRRVTGPICEDPDRLSWCVQEKWWLVDAGRTHTSLCG